MALLRANWWSTHITSVWGNISPVYVPKCRNLCNRLQRPRSCLRSMIATEASSNEKFSAKEVLDLTFAELHVDKVEERLGRLRVRQHVNPLKAALMAPMAAPKWCHVFQNPTLPIAVDIGCGPGRFLMLLAKRCSGERNFLGLDIREKLIERSKVWAEELNLENIHFLTANATVNFDSLISTYPGAVSLVTILCPDPHFKKRHKKRRIVKTELVDSVVKHLAPGGLIFLQSDVKDVAVDMKQQFDRHLGVSLVMGEAPCDSENWVLENPLGIPTEREIHAVAQGERIYRVLYRRL